MFAYHTKQRLQGFTLIEVMVAMMILAIGFAGLMHALGYFSHRHVQLRDRFWTQNIAWNHAVNIHLEAKKSLAGNDSGQMDMLNTTWNWRVRVYEVSPELYRVDVDAGTLSSRNYTTRITTFVGAPGNIMHTP